MTIFCVVSWHYNSGMKSRIVTLLMMLIFVLQPYAQQRKTVVRKATSTKVAKKTAQTKRKTTTAKKKTTVGKTTSIKGLQNEREKVKKQIQQQQQRLRANERDVKKRLQNLMVINSEIEGKRKTIDSIDHEIDSLNADIRKLDRQLAKLKKELADKKDKYVYELEKNESPYGVALTITER